MILLHDAHYPERAVPIDDVRKAWLDAGFPRFSAPTKKGTLTGHDIKGIVNAQLLAAGATLTAPDSGDFEVPDEMAPMLAALEKFYLALYPEMKDERPPRNFFYETVEWLGEF